MKVIENACEINSMSFSWSCDAFVVYGTCDCLTSLIIFSFIAIFSGVLRAFPAATLGDYFCGLPIAEL